MPAQSLNDAIKNGVAIIEDAANKQSLAIQAAASAQIGTIQGFNQAAKDAATKAEQNANKINPTYHDLPTHYMEAGDQAVQIPIGYKFIEILYHGDDDPNTEQNDVIQTMPNGFNIKDGFRLYIRNSMKENTVTMIQNQGGQGIDGAAQFVINPETDCVFQWMSSASNWTFMSVKRLYGGGQTPSGDGTVQVGMFGKPSTYQHVSKILFEEPMEINQDPDNASVRVDVKHGYFEQAGSPSYYARLNDQVEVVGHPLSDKGKHTGDIWCDDQVSTPNPYFTADRVNKAISAVGWTLDDPNITGGDTMFVGARVAFNGIAEEDGKIIMTITKQSQVVGSPVEVAVDVNNKPIVVTRKYKIGEVLGYLDVNTLAKVAGSSDFRMEITDTFTREVVAIEGIGDGLTCICLQGVSDKTSYGSGLLQYEADTNQRILTGKHYLGESMTELMYILSKEIPEEVVSSGNRFLDSDGFFMDVVEGSITTSVSGKILQIVDDGSISDYIFGAIHKDWKTKALAGKRVKVSVTLEDADDGWNIGVFKYKGDLSALTPQIYTGRNNVSLIMNTGWTLDTSNFISEDVASGFHTESFDFVVPDDADAYAIGIYPVEAQSPNTLKIKELKEDVVSPFYYYTIKGVIDNGETHLKYSTAFARFQQGVEGFQSLRYTQSYATAGYPMPCGEKVFGKANITVDNTVNIVSGSSATGGEGGYKFTQKATAEFSNIEVLQSTDDKNGNHTVYWWAELDAEGNGSFNRIPESYTSFTVDAGDVDVKHMLKDFSVKVKPNSRIIWRAYADAQDGAYIASHPSHPMLTVDITLTNIIAP